jgi:hypothetical protein
LLQFSLSIFNFIVENWKVRNIQEDIPRNILWPENMQRLSTQVCIIYNVQLTLVISNSMGPWKKFESTVVRLKRSYEDTGSVVCLTTKGRQLERNFEELKPASHVPILGTILNIFDVFVAVFFSPLNSLNLMKRLITSRYLFLCEWICLSVLFMFFTCCIVIKLHPSWRIFLCAILFIYNKWCVFIIQ